MNFSKFCRKNYPSTKMEKIRAMRDYAKEAAEMTRNELEQEYIKLQFARTMFFEIPEGFWKIDDEDDFDF